MMAYQKRRKYGQNYYRPSDHENYKKECAKSHELEIEYRRLVDEQIVLVNIIQRVASKCDEYQNKINQFWINNRRYGRRFTVEEKTELIETMRQREKTMIEWYALEEQYQQIKTQAWKIWSEITAIMKHRDYHRWNTYPDD
jgi:hypothetical protein